MKTALQKVDTGGSYLCSKIKGLGNLLVLQAVNTLYISIALLN